MSYLDSHHHVGRSVTSSYRLHALVHGRNAHAQIHPPFSCAAILFTLYLARNEKTCILNHLFELLLRRKAFNALNKVLVAVPIPSHNLPNQRDCAEAPPLVDPIE